MRTATVVGAGIGGPAAALTLANAGWDVTIREARQPADLNSVHLLELSGDVLDRLTSDYGIPRASLVIEHIAAVQAGDAYGMRGDAAFRGDAGPEVRWLDLHNALASRCDVQYGSRVTTQPGTDLVVWADGVGSTGRALHDPGRRGTYAGEMLIRGETPRRASDDTWLNLIDLESQTWQMVTYPTTGPDGQPLRGWTMFAPMAEPWDDTEELTPGQRDALCDTYRPVMSPQTFALLRDATHIQASPQLTWPPVERLRFTDDGQPNVMIGDACGTVSPRTTMGANLALMEATTLAGPPSARWDAYMSGLVNDVLKLSRAIIGTSGLTGIHG